MKTIAMLILFSFTLSVAATEEGIIEVIQYQESNDPCIIYKGETCILDEEQAQENLNQQSVKNESICLVYYKEKCILNKEQAIKNYKAASKSKHKSLRQSHTRLTDNGSQRGITAMQALDNLHQGL